MLGVRLFAEYASAAAGRQNGAAASASAAVRRNSRRPRVVPSNVVETMNVPFGNWCLTGLCGQASTALLRHRSEVPSVSLKLPNPWRDPLTHSRERGGELLPEVTVTHPNAWGQWRARNPDWYQTNVNPH